MRSVGCWGSPWALMRVVKGYDSGEENSAIPCEMNHQRFDGDSKRRRNQRKDGRSGRRETGLSSLLFQPCLWVMKRKV